MCNCQACQRFVPEIPAILLKRVRAALLAIDRRIGTDLLLLNERRSMKRQASILPVSFSGLLSEFSHARKRSSNGTIFAYRHRNPGQVTMIGTHKNRSDRPESRFDRC